MPYVALYRKYRSQTFEDVLGQEHVTKTIRNAIESGKIGHAYLFCGSRGTGKTTVARIIAKAVNCIEGPTGKPCNKCPACISINEGSAVDVIEMDAASHRGVQDVDALREGVKYPPMSLRYKVYIIDEAHQLSATAKDAFLKTLEEPPDHAIFILATTEAHAIPPTIRSRCQQFDFRRGSIETISERLRYVASQEGVKIQEDAVRLLADAAAGSWRDSLSLLEQVIAYTNETITADDVISVLGTVGKEALKEVTDVIADGNAAKAFETAEKLVAEGKDIGQLLKSLASHFRDLIFASSGAPEAASGLFSLTELKEQSSRFSRENLLNIIDIFCEAEKELRWNDQHRLVLEMALLKAMERPHTLSISHKTVSIEPEAYPITAQRDVIQRPEPIQIEKSAEEPSLMDTSSEPTELLSPVRAGEDQITLHEVKKAWDQVLSTLRGGKQASIYALLREAKLFSLEGSVLTLAFEPKYTWHKEQTQRPDIAMHIENTLARVFGVKMKIEVILAGSSQSKKQEKPEQKPNTDIPVPKPESETYVSPESEVPANKPEIENLQEQLLDEDEYYQTVFDVFPGETEEP